MLQSRLLTSSGYQPSMTMGIIFGLKLVFSYSVKQKIIHTNLKICTFLVSRKKTLEPNNTKRCSKSKVCNMSEFLNFNFLLHSKSFKIKVKNTSKSNFHYKFLKSFGWSSIEREKKTRFVDFVLTWTILFQDHILFLTSLKTEQF